MKRWQWAKQTQAFLLAILGIVVLGTAATTTATDKELTQRGGPGAGPASWTDDLTPITKADWSRNRAAHLLERAGFGGTPEEVDRLAAMTPEAAVRWLVQYQKVDNTPPSRLR